MQKKSMMKYTVMMKTVVNIEKISVNLKGSGLVSEKGLVLKREATNVDCPAICLPGV